MSSRETFNKAIEIVLAHEGGYVDHQNDRGGATNFGISSRSNPGVDIEHLTREKAIDIYWTSYWRGQGYELLPLHVAIKTFDLGVNMGRSRAVTCLQRALRACGTIVDVDGVLGPQTAGATAGACELVVMAALRSEAAGQYRMILLRDPSQMPFTVGWMKRAYS